MRYGNKYRCTEAPRTRNRKDGKCRIAIGLDNGVKASYPECYTPTGAVKGVERCNNDQPISLAKVVRNSGYMARHSNGAWRVMATSVK